MEERLVIKSMEDALQHEDFIMSGIPHDEKYEERKWEEMEEIRELLLRSPNGVEIRRFTRFEKVEEKKPYEPPRLDRAKLVELLEEKKGAQGDA